MRFFVLILITLGLYADKHAPLYFNGNCVTCHEIDRDVSAPSIKKIKQRYMDAFPAKKDFVAYMADWVHKPKTQTSLMHDSIKEYEIMPTLAFDYETLKIISAYIYENEF